MKIQMLAVITLAASSLAHAAPLKLTAARKTDAGRAVVKLNEVKASIVLTTDADVASGDDFVSVNLTMDGVHYTFDIGKPKEGQADLAAARTASVDTDYGAKGPKRVVGEQTDADGWILAYEAHAESGKALFAGVAYRKSTNLSCRVQGAAEDGGLTLEQAKRGLSACMSLTKSK